MDRTLTGTTTLSQSGPESNDNEGVLHIPQSSKTEALPLDGNISRTLIGWGFLPLYRSVLCIFYPQLTGLCSYCKVSPSLQTRREIVVDRQLCMCILKFFFFFFVELSDGLYDLDQT